MKENRCTLCGGRLLNGRCTECGLDNTKDDKKYHLNTHNDSTPLFHRGSCEDHLNRRKPYDAASRTGAGGRGSQTGVSGRTAGTARGPAGSQAGGGRAQTVGGRAQTVGSRSQTAGGRAQTVGSRSQTVGGRAQTVGSRSQTGDGRAQAGNAGRNAAGSGKTGTESYRRPGQTAAERRRELKKRRQTGTVQRKRGKKWILVVILILIYVLPAVFDMVRKLYFEFPRSQFGQFLEGVGSIRSEDGPAPAVEGASLREREPQGLPDAKVLLSGEMTAGEDFLAGVYDVCTGAEDGSAILSIDRSTSGEFAGTVSVDDLIPAVKRVPFREGDVLTLEDYSVKGSGVYLVPSY